MLTKGRKTNKNEEYMPNKRVPLITGGYYHIYNRGVAKQPTFLSSSDYQQALLSFSYYRFSKPPIKFSTYKKMPAERREALFRNLQQEGNTLVDIISFVLMPNHFHFLLKQKQEKGIATFISKFTNSYTKYFNTKHENVGPIFQGVFKDVLIETDEQLIHVSRYIHLNPLVASIIQKNTFLSYPYSSFGDFLNGESLLINMQPILDLFPSKEAYIKFVLDQEDYGRKLEIIKHHYFDE